MKTTVYVNGLITDPDQAVVPALDRGFLYGDSVYEVLWWHRGALIQAREHFDRLEASGDRLYMTVEPSRASLGEAIEQTCRAAELEAEDDAYVRLIVTRGVGPLGLAIGEHLRQSVIVIVAPANRPTPEVLERGLSMAWVDRRRTSREALDPAAKTGNYLNNLLALKEARLAGADDALMLNAAGEVAEGTTSNVYAIQAGRLVTPRLEAGILQGTTRGRILALCGEAGIRASESRLTPAEVAGADEVFVSSSVRGILPVLLIDGRPVGSGRMGPVTRRIHALFEAAADAEAASKGNSAP